MPSKANYTSLVCFSADSTVSPVLAQWTNSLVKKHEAKSEVQRKQFALQKGIVKGSKSS